MSPIILPAVGTVNGVNKDFRTPSPYVPGSVVVYLNGFSKEKAADDGWEETGYDRFRMKEAPKVGDQVQVYYLRQ